MFVIDVANITQPAVAMLVESNRSLTLVHGRWSEDARLDPRLLQGYVHSGIGRHILKMQCLHAVFSFQARCAFVAEDAFYLLVEVESGPMVIA